METSTIPPHLQPQQVPVLYPATKQAFRQVTDAPIFAVRMSRIKSSWLILLWSLVLAAFAFLFANPFLFHSSNIFLWSGEVFVILFFIAIVCTVGLVGSRRYGTRITTWHDYINAYSVYEPVIAFSTGVYLRKNTSEQNFIFLPWNFITTTAIENSPRTLVLNLSPQISSPIENPLRILLEGEILDAYGIDTPEKVAQAIQSMVQSAATSQANGTALEIPSAIVTAKNSAQISIWIGLGLIFLAILAYMWYSSH